MGGLLGFLHACRRGVRHSNGYCNGSRGARPRYDGFYGTGMLSGARVVRAEREVYQPRGVKKGTVERSCRLPASRRPASYQFNGPDTVKNCRERARPARRPRSRLHRHVAWFVPAAVRRNFRPGRRTFLSRRTPCDIHCSTPTRPPWRGVHPNPTLASPCRGVPRGGVSHEQRHTRPPAAPVRGEASGPAARAGRRTGAAGAAAEQPGGTRRRPPPARPRRRAPRIRPCRS
jgi:hypothetical protein